MNSQTVLEPYAYSGREDLTEIEIPAGTVSIGRYAFYNCRNLKKLYLHSDIRDLGAGVFTGCRKIDCIEITMEEGPSILKELLMELNQQLVVICHGAVEAKLWFPEYFEEGVENTPARILEDHVHGSGLMYRNCFVKTRLNYEEYDRRFIYSCASESAGLNVRLAFDRLCFPWELKDRAKEQYMTYLKEHRETLYQYMGEEKAPQQIRQYLALFSPSEEELQTMLAYMRSAGFTEAVVYLMAEHHESFGGKRRSFSL